MPIYCVKISIDKEKKSRILKILQPSMRDAEIDAKRQFPDCKISDITRDGNGSIRAVNR